MVKAWGSGKALLACAALAFSLATLAVKVAGSTIPVFQLTATSSCVCLVGTGLLLHAASEEVAPASAHTMRLVLLRGLLGSAAINLLYISLLWLPMKVRGPGSNSNV